MYALSSTAFSWTFYDKILQIQKILVFFDY